jgi:hypothetical protein
LLIFPAVKAFAGGIRTTIGCPSFTGADEGAPHPESAVTAAAANASDVSGSGRAKVCGGTATAAVPDGVGEGAGGAAPAGAHPPPTTHTVTAAPMVARASPHRLMVQQ